MSKIALVVVLAVAACLIPDAMSSCSSSQIHNLESQIVICSQGLPVGQNEGYAQWARDVSSSMREESTCQLKHAVGYFKTVLKNRRVIPRRDITRATTCLKNAVTYDICC